MPAAQNHQVDKQEINGVAVTITTYQIGDKFYCHIANQDPGATISRAEGVSVEEAKQTALAKATKRVAAS